MPIETEFFPCGHCKMPVETQWVVKEPRTGLLNGPYALLGDVFFHTDTCLGVYLKDAEEAQASW